GTGTLSS
ncbi:hypothetical protein CFC21_015347, partial [Triticum aestivum]